MKKILDAAKNLIILEAAIVYVAVDATIKEVKEIAKSFKKEEN